MRAGSPRSRCRGVTAAIPALMLAILSSCMSASPTDVSVPGTATVETPDEPPSSTPAVTATAPPPPTNPVSSPSTVIRPTPKPTVVTTSARSATAPTSTGAPQVTEGVVNPAAASSTSTIGAVDEAPEVTAPQPAGLLELSIMGVFAHDPDAFTQGLVFHDGLLYESTGLYGRSSVRIVDPAGGQVLVSAALDSRYFGEGLEVVGDRVVQLTWKEETALVWNARTLEPLGTFDYDGEGWGLCAFDDRFVMSNGSSMLTFRDLDTFEMIGKVEVLLSGEPVEDLNELECVGDLVYANVWFSDEIMVIDPDTGRVIASVDGAPLRERLSSTEGIDVLNGIAYDPRREVFYLTGKLWPSIFEVRIGTPP